jgi:hypothetical protein
MIWVYFGKGNKTHTNFYAPKKSLLDQNNRLQTHENKRVTFHIVDQVLREPELRLPETEESKDGKLTSIFRS